MNKKFNELAETLRNKADQNGDGKLDREDLEIALRLAASRFMDDRVENILIAVFSFGIGLAVALLFR